MNNIKYIYFASNGAEIAKKLQKSFGGEIFKKDIETKEYLRANWDTADAFVFISATGICVRLIKDFIVSKTKDPAIIVIDNSAKFAISLLSGHIGNANLLAKAMAKSLNAIPVITTASDLLGVEAVDMYAKRLDLEIDDIKTVTKVTATIVDGKKLAIIGEYTPKLDYENVDYLKAFSNGDYDAAIIISEKKNLPKLEIANTILRPKILNLGVGCKKDTDPKAMREFLAQVLEAENLSEKSIKNIASIDIKANERAILELAKALNLKAKFFSSDMLNNVSGDYKRSDFVKKTVGTFAVSSPAALILGGELIVDKATKDGMTISITKINLNEEN